MNIKGSCTLDFERAKQTINKEMVSKLGVFNAKISVNFPKEGVVAVFIHFMNDDFESCELSFRFSLIELQMMRIDFFDENLNNFKESCSIKEIAKFAVSRDLQTNMCEIGI